MKNFERLGEEFDGTWRFPEKEEPEGWNYLHFSRGNRIVQFHEIEKGRFKCGKMLVGLAGDQVLQFFPRDGGEGWTRRYRFENDQLIIINEGEGREFRCSKMEEIPGWLVRGIAESDQYFDEEEPKWGQTDS